MLNEFDKFQAVIEGVACGDALGWPVEFMRVAAIKARYGPKGITDLSQTRREFTDDTQMTVALAEGLLDAKAAATAALPDSGTTAERAGLVGEKLSDSKFVMPFIARRFAEWSVSPKNTRAPGNTCMAACRQLVAGKPWTESGVAGSKGCGAAMRVAPLGLVYTDHSVVGRLARASARITHGHPVAAQAAHLAALGVRLLLDGMKPEYLVGALVIAAEAEGGLDHDFKELLARVPYAVDATLHGTRSPEEIQVNEDEHKLALGEAWKADSAVACALYCLQLAAARGEGYVETVRYGANTEGDSDSIAAIAGSFAGAWWGLHEDKQGLPVEWACTIEDAQALAGLATRLYGANLLVSGEVQKAR